MTLFPRKYLVAGMAALVLAACGDDNSGPTAPSTPTGLAVAALTATSTRITWTAVSGATSYTLQRSVVTDPTTFVDLSSTLTAATYDDAGLTPPLSNYLYRVSATNSVGTSAPSATRSVGAFISGNITASRTLYSDTVYTLSGYVKVQSGATLTIQPGTKIVGDTTAPGSSLWILRGAKIEANGTAVAPIVFTSARAAGNRKPGDWGGLIIIGNGKINRTGDPILTEGGAAGVAVNYAGGTDNNDNSGTLRYVRIEFAGYDISNGAGQELNTLSSYAVGRGTTYEYIQSMTGLDDSFEWWGGAVDSRYLVSYESGDDHFDWTEGYQGRNQFMIAFQSTRITPAANTGTLSSDPRGFEGDGCDPLVAGCTVTATGASTPYSMPVFANFTMIGTGDLVAAFPPDGNGGVWRRGTGATVYNGIMGRYKGTAINIRDAWTDTLWTGWKAPNTKDSLWISNTLLAQNGADYDPEAGTFYGQPSNWDPTRLATMKTYPAGTQIDALLGLGLTAPALNWKPSAASPAATGGLTAPPALITARTQGYFANSWVNTSYLGAVDPAAGTLWYSGWTVYQTN